MVTSSSPVRQIFSANQSRKGRKNPEPGTEVPGKEATETKSPLGTMRDRERRAKWHIVGDARAPQERRSDSILASSLALLPVRASVEA